MFTFILQHHRLALCLFLSAGLSSACSNHLGSSDCDLTLENAPDVRDVRLGMSMDEFRQRFRISDNPAPPSGDEIPAPDSYGATVVPTQATTVRDGMGVYDLKRGTAHVGRLLFVDGRVAHFRVIYDDHVDSVNWESVDQFAGKMSESLGLPNSWVPREELRRKAESGKQDPRLDPSLLVLRLYEDYWHPTARNTQERFLFCGDVLVTAGVPSPGKRQWTNGAFVQFDDLAALRKVQQRLESKWDGEERKEGEQRETFKP